MFGFLKKKAIPVVSYPAGFVGGRAQGKYCVIDISGGINADTFPVSYTDETPDGGWGEEFKRTKLVLRLVPPASFTMGLESNYHVKPHAVTLTHPYYFGVFPVTFAQYEKVTGSRPKGFDEQLHKMRTVEYEASPAQQSFTGLRGKQRGAEWPQSSNVDAGTFFDVLRRKSGIGNLDLPTNAEWDFAAHGGTDSPLGNLADGAIPALADIGHFDLECSPENTDPRFIVEGRGDFPVGTKKPNRFGIYDTVGNSNEWTLDWSGFVGADELTDPAGPETFPGKDDISRIRRGVSAGSSKRGEPINVREESGAPVDWNNGFRVAFSVEA